MAKVVVLVGSRPNDDADNVADVYNSTRKLLENYNRYRLPATLTIYASVKRLALSRQV